MEQVRIAELKPELPAPESKQLRAVVTLIWPYSSSTRQFALFLAEPDLRLRRKNGQVRACFSGPSAKAIATTGVGIGDEVVLGLWGAQFVHEDNASMPGKSIEWGLSYHQTVTLHVSRSGSEIASLELVDVAPTPAPQSPVRHQTVAAPNPAQQWPSPAFLKRARLSDGSVFDAPYDAFADEHEVGHDKKRRRKSYRDWKAWKYSARTPSPEGEDMSMEDDLEAIETSPSRSTQLPKSPVSPPPLKQKVLSVTAGNLERPEDDDDDDDDDERAAAPANGQPAKEATTPIEPDMLAEKDRFVRDDDYGELYAGPDELPPSDAQFAFGGDTEINTEEKEDALQDGVDGVRVSSTGADIAELEDGHPQPAKVETIEVPSIVNEQDHIKGNVESVAQEDCLIAIAEAREISEITPKTKAESHPISRVEKPVHTAPFEDALRIEMPPPLSIFDASLPAPGVLDTRTPLGKEPSSPTLRPLDSSTLPLPSPFPGEHDSNVTSYFDHITSNEVVQLARSDFEEEEEEVKEEKEKEKKEEEEEKEEEEKKEEEEEEEEEEKEEEKEKEEDEEKEEEEDEAPNEADYIMETSFYSSISSSKAGAFQPTHESAFAPVRFTFGVDGAGSSRPIELSSPEPHQGYMDVEGVQRDMETTVNVEKTLDIALETQESTPSRHETLVQDEVSHAAYLGNADDPVAQESLSPDDTAVSVVQLATSTNATTEVESRELNTEDETPKAITDSFDAESERSSEEDVSNDQDSAIEYGAPPDERFLDIDRMSEGSDYHVDRDKGEFASDPMKSIAAGSDKVDIEGSQVLQTLDNYNEPDNTQQSAVVSDIVDLGSPSEDDSDEEEHTVESRHDDTNEEEPEGRYAHSKTATRRSPTPVQHQDPVTYAVKPASKNNHSELAATGHMHEVSTSVASHSEPIAYPDPSQALETENNSSMERYSLVDNWEPQLGMDYSNTLMEDTNMLNEAPSTFQSEHLFPDIKMESIEEDSLFQLSQQDAQPPESSQDSDKLVIAVPQEGDKVGKLKYVSVPATGPARNTRSKTKTSITPSKEDVPAPKRSTRSKESKMSLNSNVRATISPPRTRGRSTAPLSQDALQMSPSDSPSWSWLVSPTKNTSISAGAATHWSDRKPVPQRSVSSFSDLDLSQHDRDTFATSFEPSQELGTSQGRYHNVSFVKDSEEDSLHSEHSISTVQNSDDQDPELLTTPKPNSRITISLGSSSPAQPSYTQPPIGSLSKHLRPAPSSNMTSQGRQAKRKGYDIFPEPSAAMEEQQGDATPKSGVQDVAHFAMSGEGEGEDNQPRESSQLIDINEFIRSSPPVATAAFPSIKQESVMDSNRLMTPEATQRTTRASQSSQHQQQSVLLTPQHTQTTSTGLSSLKPVVEEASATKSPHRNTAVIDVASSPKLHSADNSNSDDEATLIAHAERPSIGLSTPLAYYTPLKDLIYFLNRSSQFHSSANPDILALVTSATTTAAKATKGPRHWKTILHVTDISSWPATTMVQVYRAYEAALPVAERGDVILLRAFGVKSSNRSATLVSAEESSWCVWRYGKPVWGAKRGAFGEVRAREEVRGPDVERGEGEWKEVERLRGWYVNKVIGELDGKTEELT